jgi:N,N'-diacetylchitobiose transport system permease protein
MGGASWTPWALLSPALIAILLLVGSAIVLLALMSFTDMGRRTLFTGAYDSVGLANYKDIFTDPDFWAALFRTIWFTAAMVAGSVLVGMLFATLMTRLGTFVRYVLVVALVFAWAMPNVASTQVWNWLFQPGYGVVNWLLTQLHVFGDLTQTDWSANTWLGYLSIWLLIVWQAVPFVALTLYAAQSQIDPSFYEAARLDGAGEWRIYRQITLPFLAPTLTLITILSVFWDFNVFNQIWLLTGGGPGNSTSTLGIWTYKTAFVSFDIGQGAAIALVTTVLLMLFSAFYVRRLLRSGEDL